MTLADLAKEYLAQHDGQPETTAKLRWLLTKPTAAFGSTPLTELDACEIASWRIATAAVLKRRAVAGRARARGARLSAPSATVR